MTPEEAATEMDRLCATLTSHALHRAADDLMCQLMRQQGYDAAVDRFLVAVGDYHATTPTPEEIRALDFEPHVPGKPCPVGDDVRVQILFSCGVEGNVSAAKDAEIARLREDATVATVINTTMAFRNEDVRAALHKTAEMLARDPHHKETNDE